MSNNRDASNYMKFPYNFDIADPIAQSDEFEQVHEEDTEMGGTPEFAPDELMIEHMKNIKSRLEKEPALKEDIKKIIVDQLVKAKIKPEQYKELSEKKINHGNTTSCS